MKLETVYNKEGECLGNEYVSLDDLRPGTKKAIIQIISLEGIIRVYEGAVDKMSQTEQAG